MLDKETIKRILHLHQVRGLEARVIAERFGFSSSRVHNVIRRQAGLAARAQRDAAQFNLKLKLKNKKSKKLQAASRKPQAPSSKRLKFTTMMFNKDIQKEIKNYAKKRS